MNPSIRNQNLWPEQYLCGTKWKKEKRNAKLNDAIICTSFSTNTFNAMRNAIESESMRSSNDEKKKIYNMKHRRMKRHIIPNASNAYARPYECVYARNVYSVRLSVYCFFGGIVSSRGESSTFDVYKMPTREKKIWMQRKKMSPIEVHETKTVSPPHIHAV